MKFFYHTYPNFGDAMNPILMEHLTGNKWFYSSKFRAEYIGIGSILDIFTREKWYYSSKTFLAGKAKIWTSGYSLPGKEEERFFRKMKVLALRGKISLERTERILGKKLSVPLGDGGLLFNLLLERPVEKKYFLGLVPHFADYGSIVFEKIQESISHSVLIDVRDDPMSVLEKIASCDFILSSAMHGLIAADSLGIPNIWLKLSDNPLRDAYKFNDYYSVFDIEAPIFINEEEAGVLNSEKIKDLMDKYPVTQGQVEKIQKELVDCLLKNLD